MILGLDPGTYGSGWALFEPGGQRVKGAGEWQNEHAERVLAGLLYPDERFAVDTVAIEMIGHYGTGMSVGAETYHTVLWIGRWLKVCELAGVEAVLLRRPSIKAELCGTAKAKDGQVAQALRDLLGERGTKKNPGPTYGVSGHAWQALAVAVAYSRGVPSIEWRGRPVVPATVSAPDRMAGSPKAGDMIARNPKNDEDRWLVAAQFFADNFEEVMPNETGNR